MGGVNVIPELGLLTTRQISDYLAVCTTELVAIWMALLWVERNRGAQAVIASDSSSPFDKHPNIRV